MDIFTNHPALEQFASLIVGLFMSLSLLYLTVKWFERRMNRQIDFIKTYEFPKSVTEFIKQKYPHLSDADVELALEQLRVYFLACWHENMTLVLPSKVVNTCWHGFELEKKSYNEFGRAAFGRFVNRMPRRSEAVKDQINLRDGARCYQAVLALSNISMTNSYTWQTQETLPSSIHIPVLFSADHALEIPNGYLFADEVIQLMANFEIRKLHGAYSSDI